MREPGVTLRVLLLNSGTPSRFSMHRWIFSFQIANREAGARQRKNRPVL